MTTIRRFRLIGSNYPKELTERRFLGRKPLHAFHKAASLLFKTLNKKKIEFNIVECCIKDSKEKTIQECLCYPCTTYSRRLVYKCIGERKILQNPTIIKIKDPKTGEDKTIEYKYANHVKCVDRCKYNEFCNLD